MNTRPRTIAAAMLVLAFCVGGFTGMALEEALGLDWFDFLDEDSRPAEGRLLANLNLSPSQQRQIEDILDAREERLEDYWETRIPDMQELVAQSYEEIRHVMTPDQREVLDERIRAQGIPVPGLPD